MLIPEARWFAAAMKAIGDDDLFPLLNVGSQSRRFREQQQPWLDHYIFAPLRKRGGRVVHSDLQHEEGVDLVGDLTDPAFLNHLRSLRFRSVVCTNLLEHVEKPERIAATLAEVVEPGGRLFVSVPYRFPYHPDPIDTMYRPSVEELARLFPGTVIRRSEIVPCGTLLTLLWTYCRWTPRRVLGVAFQRGSAPATGGTSPARPSRIKTLLPWCFRTFRTTCLVLQRPGNLSGASPS